MAKGKGKGKKKVTENPYGIQFRDDVQEARYNSLVARIIAPTRYMDELALLTLGLLDDVHYLFANVGWTKFVGLKHFTYARITLEFLSSVNANVSYAEGWPEDHHDNLITFRLFNTEHSLSLSQFNAIYGFPYGGQRRVPHEFSARGFWGLLTKSDSYDSSSSKSSKLRNPCFRYVHRVMSNTLFGRGDSDGVVRQSELLFLWNMLHPEVQLDAGSHLITHMVKVGKASAGKIVIGGLITPIAEALGYRTSGLPFVRGSTRLDMEACLAMRMIVKEGQCYCLVLPDTEDTHPLPDQEHTTIRNQRNWNFPGGPQPEPLQEERPEAPPGSSSQYFTPQPPPGSYAALQEEMAAQRAQLTGLDNTVHNIQDMVSAMYNWHLQQYPGQFPPPPPQ